MLLIASSDWQCRLVSDVSRTPSDVDADVICEAHGNLLESRSDARVNTANTVGGRLRLAAAPGLDPRRRRMQDRQQEKGERT